MENVNDNNQGNTVKIQKYQCWKCEGKGQFVIHDRNTTFGLEYEDCDLCNGKGYIPLIPYQS